MHVRSWICLNRATDSHVLIVYTLAGLQSPLSGLPRALDLVTANSEALPDTALDDIGAAGDMLGVVQTGGPGVESELALALLALGRSLLRARRYVQHV